MLWIRQHRLWQSTLHSASLNCAIGPLLVAGPECQCSVPPASLALGAVLARSLFVGALWPQTGRAVTAPRVAEAKEARYATDKGEGGPVG